MLAMTVILVATALAVLGLDSLVKKENQTYRVGQINYKEKRQN
jgi:hypothetical protein